MAPPDLLLQDGTIRWVLCYKLQVVGWCFCLEITYPVADTTTLLVLFAVACYTGGTRNCQADRRQCAGWYSGFFWVTEHCFWGPSPYFFLDFRVQFGLTASDLSDFRVNKTGIFDELPITAPVFWSIRKVLAKRCAEACVSQVWAAAQVPFFCFQRLMGGLLLIKTWCVFSFFFSF